MKVRLRGKIAEGLPKGLVCIQASLALLGLVLAAWPAFLWVESGYAQWSGQKALESENIVAAGARHQERKNVLPAGTPIGQFEIPRLGMQWVLLEGTDARTLDKSIGHVEGTALPGESGNIAVAGHRNTHFRKLEWIRRGDEIVLRTKQREYRYIVEWGRLFQPDDIEVLDAAHGPAVTLITCFPFEYIGSAPLRYVVRALPK